MELQFHKNKLSCLRLAKREVRNVEQTQELRIPEGMPAVGRVVGAWGQVLLRSKEWHGGNAQVSGGVVMCVLYIPEDGAEVQQVETWIPFQAKWELPATDMEGIICADALLRSADARSISAGKLMVRVNVGVMGEFWLKEDAWTFAVPEIPEDVALLRRTCSIQIPKLAGEKSFALEEELTFPANTPAPAKLLRCGVQCELIDKKILSDKVVFRGMALLHTLYKSEDGQLHTWDFELPFSQYGELEQECEQGNVRIIMAPTSMEADLDTEGRLHLKAGFTGQYLVCDSVDMEVVEDAYSPIRTVVPQMQTLEISVVQQLQQQTVEAEQTVHTQGNMLELTFLPDHPSGAHTGMPATLTGQFQLLYQDETGAIQSTAARWEQPSPLGTEEGAQTLIAVRPSGKPQTAYDGTATLLHADMLMDNMILGSGGIPMVTALEISETKALDSNRPSLILRRAGDQTLWQLAKEYGSTVEAIQSANKLEGAPTTDQMLLIPVL